MPSKKATTLKTPTDSGWVERSHNARSILSKLPKGLKSNRFTLLSLSKSEIKVALSSGVVTSQAARKKAEKQTRKGEKKAKVGGKGDKVSMEPGKEKFEWAEE
jgi:hypothetical protein